jgi:LysM repeat protein
MPRFAFASDDYVVQDGETLSQIADRFGFPIQTLLDVNGITDPDSIHAGQVIQIPGLAPGVSAPVPTTSTTAAYTVAAGDTLASIADKYGVSLSALANANAITNVDSIVIGQVLAVPGEAPSAPASTTAAEPEAPGTTYTVKSGDTLFTIAGGFGVSVTAIVEANGLASENLIRVGDVLAIPGVPGSSPVPSPGLPSGTSGIVHVVVAGETLSGIADQYGVTLAALAAANDLADLDSVRVGDKLLVPVAGPQAPTPSNQSHIVHEGETLSDIAARYGVSVSALAEVNGISNTSMIVVGQTLTLPDGAKQLPPPPDAQHTVQPGESLASIAAAYGTSTQALAAANGIDNPNLIVPGQILDVPAGTASAASRQDMGTILENAAAEFGISAALVKAVAWQESGWNQAMVSHAGAVGVMQVIPPTADWALLVLVPSATEWDTNPVDNARMGAAILQHWLVESNWDVDTAVAAYFQGWRSLHEIGLFDETRDYVANVKALIPQFQ